MVGKDGMIGSAKFVLIGFAIGLADSAVIIALMRNATNTYLLCFSLVIPAFSFLHFSLQRIFLIHISSSQQILFL